MTSRIAVIIVNYGTPDLAIAAVESVLARNHGGHPVEVHLLDNASPGDDAAIFAKAHADRGWADRVTLWLEDENHGFGRGNNVVINALAARPAPPDYIFLLNPDATLLDEALATLADFLDSSPQAAVAGARIERPDGTAVTAAFRFPNVSSEFASILNLGLVTRVLSGSRVALPAELARGPVDWVSGAAVMFRLNAMQMAGFFDPDFFLYFEETELIWRLRQQGGEVWFLPEARVCHIAGAATGMRSGRHRSKAQPGYLYDSWRLYFVKTRGVQIARVAALLRYTGAGMNIILRRLTGRQPDIPMHFGRDFRRHVLTPLFLGDPEEARPDGKTPKAVWQQRDLV